MTRAPLAPYPASRLRRLRQADWTRRLVRESTLTPNDLIWSMVVHEGDERIPIPSMPGVERLPIAEAARSAQTARTLGIPTIAVFPHIDGERKDAGWIPGRRPRRADFQSRESDEGCGARSGHHV